MAGTAEVITTKLFRPSLRQHAVDRKRLHDLLRLGCTLPTLVPASAGWGQEHARGRMAGARRDHCGMGIADRGDDDPIRFWRYLLLAAGPEAPGRDRF
jgi:LuxR family transcriptional regulator, maltose regulon positive regulatory protein